jgi:hypothetical protein
MSKQVLIESRKVSLPGPDVEIPTDEMTEALWLGLAERAKYLERAASADLSYLIRLTTSGPHGDEVPFRYTDSVAQSEAWQGLRDTVRRRMERKQNIAQAMRVLYRQMCEAAEG